MTIRTPVFGSIGTGTGSFTPGAPATINAGDILTLFNAEYTGTNSPLDLSASGYTRQTPNSNDNRLVLYTKVALGGGSDVMPTITSRGGKNQFAVVAAVPGCSEVLDGTGLDRQSTSTLNFAYPTSTLTINYDNCIVWTASYRSKTSTSNGNTCNALSNANFTQALYSWPDGSTGGFVISYWIQTTKTNISALTQTQSGTADSTQGVGGFVLALRAARAGLYRALLGAG